MECAFAAPGLHGLILNYPSRAVPSTSDFLSRRCQFAFAQHSIRNGAKPVLVTPSATRNGSQMIAEIAGSHLPRRAFTFGSSCLVASHPMSSTSVGVISTTVGFLVLLGSVLYKLPQVIRVQRARSAKGISVSMYALETLATTFSLLYFFRRAFPFSTYGELFFIIAQNVVILGQVIVFENVDLRRALLLGVVYIAGCLFLVSPAAPLRLLMSLQLAAIPMLNFGRIPQIMLSRRRRSTGELSFITLLLQVMGNLARIFTTITSVGDKLMLLGVGVSTVFNSALLLQYLLYNKRVSRLRQDMN